MASVSCFPDFAVVCSFLERYGEHLQLPEVSITDLETAIGYAHCVPPLLKDIIIKLMRKTRKSFSLEKWQRYLAKMCRERFSEVAAWEVERFGFAASKPQIKIAVLRFLCETQFDENFKFKAIVNEEDPEKMRAEPMGRDKMGLVYWFHKDEDTNIRIYREEQDDPDSSTWEVISNDRDQMENLIRALRNGTNVVANQGKEEDAESTTSSDNSSMKMEVKNKTEAEDLAADAQESGSAKEDKESTEECKENADKLEENKEEAGDCRTEVETEKRTTDQTDEAKVQPRKDEEDTKEKVIIKTEISEEGEIDKEVKEEPGWTDDVKAKMEVEALSKMDAAPPTEENKDEVKQEKEEVVEDEKENSEELGQSSPKLECKEEKGKTDGESKEEGIGKSETKEVSEMNDSKEEKKDEEDSKDGDDRGKNEEIRKEPEAKDAAKDVDDVKSEALLAKDGGKEVKKSGGKEETAEYGDAGEKEEDQEQQEEPEDEAEEEKKAAPKPKKVGKKRKKKSARSRFTPRRNASRKAAVKIEEEMKEEVEEEEEEEEVGPAGEDDSPCCKCGMYNHPEWILLCDKCDSGYHTACLRPPLMIIPEGNWYCPNCEHEKLVVRLAETLTEVDASLKKKEKKRKRKDGENLWALTDICMRNIIPGEVIKVRKQRHAVALRHTSSSFRRKQRASPDEARSHHREQHHHHQKRRPQRRRRSRQEHSRDRERHWRQSLRDRDFINDNEDDGDEEEEFEMVQRRSRRARKDISYKFEDFDSAINSAIQEEVVEHKKAVKEYQATRPVIRGKDISTIEGMKESSEDETKEEKTRRKNKRRLGDLDATSEEEEDNGSEDFKMESNSASDVDYEEEGEEEVDDESYVSEESDSDGPRRKRSKRNSKWYCLPKRHSERRRKRVRYRDYSEDEEFESESEQYSEYSDESDAKSKRRKLVGRRRDSSEDSQSDSSSYQSDQSGRRHQRLKKKRQLDSESESSENTGYVRKRKFRLESDEEEDENADNVEEKPTGKKDLSDSEEDQESGPVIREKTAPVARLKRKKYTEDSDYSPSEGARGARASSKRVDYRKLAAESNSEEEEEDEEEEEEEEEEHDDYDDEEGEDSNDEEDKDAGSDNKTKEEGLRTDQDSIPLETEDSNKENERTTQPSVRDSKAKDPVKREDFPTKSVSPPVSNGTTLNGGKGGGSIVNGNSSSGNGEGITTGEEIDEDLLGVTDLVEYVTQDV